MATIDSLLTAEEPHTDVQTQITDALQKANVPTEQHPALLNVARSSAAGAYDNIRKVGGAHKTATVAAGLAALLGVMLLAGHMTGVSHSLGGKLRTLYNNAMGIDETKEESNIDETKEEANIDETKEEDKEEERKIVTSVDWSVFDKPLSTAQLDTVFAIARETPSIFYNLSDDASSDRIGKKCLGIVRDFVKRGGRVTKEDSNWAVVYFLRHYVDTDNWDVVTTEGVTLFLQFAKAVWSLTPIMPGGDDGLFIYNFSEEFAREHRYDTDIDGHQLLCQFALQAGIYAKESSGSPMSLSTLRASIDKWNMNSIRTDSELKEFYDERIKSLGATRGDLFDDIMVVANSLRHKGIWQFFSRNIPAYPTVLVNATPEIKQIWHDLDKIWQPDPSAPPKVAKAIAKVADSADPIPSMVSGKQNDETTETNDTRLFDPIYAWMQKAMTMVVTDVGSKAETLIPQVTEILDIGGEKCAVGPWIIKQWLFGFKRVFIDRRNWLFTRHRAVQLRWAFEPTKSERQCADCFDATQSDDIVVWLFYLYRIYAISREEFVNCMNQISNKVSTENWDDFKQKLSDVGFKGGISFFEPINPKRNLISAQLQHKAWGTEELAVLESYSHKDFEAGSVSFSKAVMATKMQVVAGNARIVSIIARLEGESK